MTLETEKDTTRTIISWAMYDWANSAFATTVMAGFFPVFFKEFVSSGVDPITSTARLGFANSLAGIVIVLSAPLLGAIADSGCMKKRFLMLFLFLGVLFTSCLYLVSRDEWNLAITFYMGSVIGYSGANIFYDSLLPSVGTADRMDFISTLGYSFGYLGGGILFAGNVWMVLHPASFGFASASDAVKVSFLTVGIWWLLFSLPLFLYVREPIFKKNKTVLYAMREGIARLGNTAREIRHLKTIVIFLVAYWLYIDGVGTIIRMAVDYGIAIGLSSKDLICALLITQFVGFPAAIGFGYLGKRIGTKRAIFFGLAVYCVVTVWGAFLQSTREFYVMAIAIGLVQGGVQALSRSLFARMIPAEMSAECFGFFNMLGKFSVIFGPALVGGVALSAQHLGFQSTVASRIGISSILFLFIAGAAVLYFVDEEKGGKEMEAFLKRM
ncbi:MAG: MFS transporter [Deltaproteobacteria bacterium]|nr:MFS transporter [Deltaproteobacteria bacterium]